MTTQPSSLSSRSVAPSIAPAPKPPGTPKTSRKRRPPATKLQVGAQSQEARQMAAAILEVLAGVRTTTDAAAALSVSLPRYYALETRALEGLLRACERRPRGPRRREDRELARLRREVDRLQREAARSNALLRAAQRAVGLRAVEARGPKAKPSGKRRRARRPTARALKAVDILRASAKQGVDPDAAAKQPSGEVRA